MLASAQQCLVWTQCQVLSALQAQCAQCGKQLTVKGQHQRQMRAVFGCVQVSSPRLRRCACHGDLPGASFSRLVAALPTQMSPELEYLQVKWAAHLPYTAAAELLQEVLPIGDSISVTGLRRRVRAVGAELDRTAEVVGSVAAADQQRHGRVGSQPGGQHAFCEEAADALVRRGRICWRKSGCTL